MELWDARDKLGNKLGFTVEKAHELPCDLYHLGVDVWIKNSNNQYLIQRRALEKKRMPGMWMSTGGAAISGEDGIDAACREVSEELGIQIIRNKMVRLFCNRHTSNFCEVFLARVDVDLTEIIMQPKEVMDVKWVSFTTIVELINNGEMLSCSEEYLSAIRNEAVMDTLIIEQV